MRSKLIYGQEVYFSAPNSLLKKLQSIDSKAIKLAIGVPVHTNTSKSYAEAGISLSEQRKLAIPSLIGHPASVDVKQHKKKNKKTGDFKICYQKSCSH